MMIHRRRNFFIKQIVSVSPTRLIVMGYVLVIFLGSILLNLPIASRDGSSIGYINALFTATSATCVTGLVVVDTYSHWTIFGQSVILLLIQIGGLGFMTMATLFSLALRRKISFKERLVIAESLNQYTIEGIVRLTKQVLIGTLLFEGAGALILSIKFSSEYGITKGIFKGIFHAISAFCNAGFDIMGETKKFTSLTGYTGDTIVNLTVMALVVIGGLGFYVWSNIMQAKDIRSLRLHTKLVLFISGILLVLGFVFFFLMEYNNPNTLQALSFKDKLLAAMFQSVTTRTAGFNTISLSDLTIASQVMTIVLMFIGGSPGSTAGGIKTVTLGVLIFAVFSHISGKDDTEMFNRRLHHSVVLRALSIVFIALMIVLTTTIILSIFETATFMEIFFEAVSAFGTVGLSLGITPSLSSVSKVAVIITMFLGRVGVLTMALALLMRGKKTSGKLKYPEGKVMVG